MASQNTGPAANAFICIHNSDTALILPNCAGDTCFHTGRLNAVSALHGKGDRSILLDLHGSHRAIGLAEGLQDVFTWGVLHDAMHLA
jgi:hypothetical protein